MTESTSNNWYQRQKDRDQESKALSESLLGAERDLFANAMALTVSCLDAVFAADEQINDQVVKRKISVAHYAFNLLYSAWDETLAGRYSAARDHSRSINECSDFLYALDINPGLANEMTDETTIKIETVRRTIKNALAELDKTKAAGWLTQMQKAAKSVEPFSHVSVKSLGGTLPVMEKLGAKAAVVRLGGAVSPLILRAMAIDLALSALSLLTATVFGFRDVVQVDHDLFKALVSKAHDYIAELAKEIETLRNDCSGTVQAVYFARFDEEV